MAQAFCEVGEPGELTLHISADRCAPRGHGLGVAPQSHVQHGTVFGGVDGITLEHRLRLFKHTAFAGQLQQGLHHSGCHALTRSVGMDACGFKLQTIVARTVMQQFAQMQRRCLGDSL